jgi:hypothetical protein
MLMKDKPFQPDIFNGTQWLITFSDLQDQILKKQFLSRVQIFIWHSRIEEINNGGCFFCFLEVWWIIVVVVVIVCRVHCVVLLQHCIMLWGHMSTHYSCGMVFVIHNQSFFILSRILSYKFLLDAMIHNTSHLLRLKTIYNNNMVINFF